MFIPSSIIKSLGEKVMKGKKLLTILLVLLLASSSLFAAITGNLGLSGSVSLTQSITVTGAGVFDNLDLTATQTTLKIADIVATSNFKAYLIKASSTNAGQLLGAIVADNGTEYMDYQIQLLSASVTGTFTTMTTTPATIYTGTAKATDYAIALNIKYTGKSDLQSDIYTDTVTLTISKN
jgi:hypothetical protein